MKKGFTLIELLAVILILGIIALIAIPTISKLLEDARIEAFRTTARNIAIATETSCNKNIILNKPVPNYTFRNGKVNGNLEISGELPKRGYSESDSNCNVGLSITNGTYRADKVYSNEEITITKCDNTGNCDYNTNITEDNPLRSCYTFNSSTKTIEKYDKEHCPLDVVIPETIDGVEVENIGEQSFTLVDYYRCNVDGRWQNFQEKQEGVSCTVYLKKDSEGNILYPLNSVVLPRTLKTIEALAFENNNIDSINIPNSVTDIGDYAFWNNAITSVYLPDSVTNLYRYAFGKNPITEFTFSKNMNTMTEGTIYYTSLTNLTVPSNIKTIQLGNMTLNLQTLIIEEGVEQIDDNAFSYNSNLNKLRLPSTLKHIGMAAFSGCNVTDGPDYIYQRNPDGSENTAVLNSYAGANKSITLPSQIKEIEDRAFDSCDITSITLNNGLEHIGQLAFIRNQISLFDLPSSITTLEEEALWKWSHSNPSLTKVINRTGKAFDWTYVLDTYYSTPQVFKTGTARTTYGNVTITDS